MTVVNIFKCKGTLTLTKTITTEVEVKADQHGNVAQGDVEEDVTDVVDTYLTCSKCGTLDSDELEDHGLSEYWEEV